MADDIMTQYVERAMRRECQRLDDQAKTFVAMGFDPSELMIVRHDDNPPEVIPHMGDKP